MSIENQMKILTGRSENYKRALQHAEIMKNVTEPPMMLDSWTQTASSDFDHLFNQYCEKYESQFVEDLREKVRVLEEELKKKTGIVPDVRLPQSAVNPPQAVHLKHDNYLLYQNCQTAYNNIQTISPQYVQMSNGTAAIINNVMQPVMQHPVKYTIVTENGHNGDTGEVRIITEAENVRANSNASAESCGLRICLSDENLNSKPHYDGGNTKIVMRDDNISPIIIKRRRTNCEEPEKNKFLAEASVLHTPPSPLSSSPSPMSFAAKVEPGSVVIERTPKKILYKSTITKPVPIKNNTNTAQGFITPKAQNREGVDLEGVMISIGPNNTRVPAKVFESINWASASIATRKLLMQIFDRETLASHSMTGKPSPAFKDHCKPLKKMLNPLIIADVIFAVTRKCGVSEKEVRTAITTKCADENKMRKLQIIKQNRTLREINKENVTEPNRN
ncbi:protein insensitive [Teleopsis dalmanni]|uniref:protein insensitive n=1 Tax=Teleopsis dalmanni TaxID=139649 RepID=UPI0018CDE87C|nr:protein insensitive [Teleopsis dalmanni]